MTATYEKYTLPAEPTVGSSVKAGEDTFTRENRPSGYSGISVDGWRKPGDAVAYTWAELFVYGRGEVQGVETNPVRLIVEKHVDDPVVVSKIVDALVASPHVDTDSPVALSGKVKVGDMVTGTSYTMNPGAYDHVKSFTDKDGDTVVRVVRDGRVKWHISFHAPSDATGLDESPLSMWGPFTVKETD